MYWLCAVPSDLFCCFLSFLPVFHTPPPLPLLCWPWSIKSVSSFLNGSYDKPQFLTRCLRGKDFQPSPFLPFSIFLTCVTWFLSFLPSFLKLSFALCPIAELNNWKESETLPRAHLCFLDSSSPAFRYKAFCCSLVNSMEVTPCVNQFLNLERRGHMWKRQSQKF